MDKTPEQEAAEYRVTNAKFVPDTQSEIILEKAYIAGRSKGLERIKELEELLEECDDYFDNYADADYIQEKFAPNPEMKLLGKIRQFLKP